MKENHAANLARASDLIVSGLIPLRATPRGVNGRMVRRRVSSP
jgi:hypothetical protein